MGNVFGKLSNAARLFAKFRACTSRARARGGGGGGFSPMMYRGSAILLR